MKIKMHAGIGTHIDAPSHCVPGGLFIDDLNLNDLCMPCFVINVEDKCHERYSLSAEEVTNLKMSMVLSLEVHA